MIRRKCPARERLWNDYAHAMTLYLELAGLQRAVAVGQTLETGQSPQQRTRLASELVARVRASIRDHELQVHGNVVPL